MPSRSETILVALHAALRTALEPATRVERNLSLPSRIPAGGIAILMDGDPGEPEQTLGIVAYHYDHVAEVEIVVDKAVDRESDAAFDRIKLAIGAALAADRTLGGLVDWMEAAAPRPLEVPVEGTLGLKAAALPIRLEYSTPDPLL